MSAFLTIRQAAERLGVSMDTLRQWERDKRLTAERTEGGHRRFRAEDIERLLARRSKTASSARGMSDAPGPPVPTAAVAGRGRIPAGSLLDSFWTGQLRDARARVETKRLTRESVEQQAEIDKRRALAQHEEEELKLRKRHRENLLDLKAFGRALVPTAIGVQGRAEITRDLEEYVTAERFPLDLPSSDAQVVVQARVSAALARTDRQRAEAAAKEERDRRRSKDQMQLEGLIASGLRVARRETWSWESIDQVRALREVGEQLRDEVCADWSCAQVEALVTEILSEFEECDEDVGAADHLDDEEGQDEED